MGGAVFVRRLRAALLHVLHLLPAAAFNSVAHNRPADQADDCRQCATASITNGVARRTASQRPQHRPAAGARGFGDELLVVADLTWHCDLLHNRRAGDDARQNVSRRRRRKREDREYRCGRKGVKNERFFHHGCLQ